MAMRPRGGGVGRPNNRPNRAPRAAVQPVYEDFRPVYERHQEQEAEKLLIYLPGFMKENIRVSTEGKNAMRVRGERFVGGNKWHRFREDYQAPYDCNMRGIHAKFENGVLIITMPWKLPEQLLDEPTKQLPLSTPPPPQKDDNVPPKTTYPTIETPRKPTPLRPTAQLPKPQNVDNHQDSEGVKEKQKDEKKILDGQLGSAESSKTEKGDYETDFPALRTTPLGRTSGEKEKIKDEKKILEGLVGSIEPKIQNKEENLNQNRMQLVKSDKEVEKKESYDIGGQKVAEKSKELIGEFQEKVEQKGSIEKESTSNAVGTSSYPGGEFSIGNLKKSLLQLNEERQLLVNAGGAVLVIMALGAYVYNSIG
ncbi:inactive protein RESTRICTED TEV MOVEMENT 2-like [Lycium ferocissimum]|uniref:inactive protein RESTRICTED TEV MOVEMENT 2-like n=1 Tax=Lycium ferocissimum TaxID=112874 RepID=UPI002815D32C|nr:inactive protein RESTRICTED TEV MOVEMENT 2-like [Lycium ferocissimum]